VGSGYSSINDVNVPGGGGWSDFQESFWFAEVLKYSYLIQTEGSEEWQVGDGGRDTWVFNTEAHPVRVVGGGKK
jgi:mannosyl-oligosaccharide alpha-1,2-mannosidase